ncbi:ABC transporter ATP-binding protein [bacterium]|nr:MAG: ABC transporter ATP-binding protein [bacterium]
MADSLLVKQLSKQYGMAPPIFKDFSYEFKGGTITGLIGQNGSGKSTLMKVLGMLSRPDSGQIIINQTNVWEKPEQYLREIGIVADWFQLPETLSFEELLDWQMEEKGIPLDEQRIIKKELKVEFNFDNRSEQIIRTYSSGMRKKTAICAALCTNPKILLFDEPFQALDAETREILANRLKSEKEAGKIVLLASHFNHDETNLLSDAINFPLNR